MVVNAHCFAGVSLMPDYGLSIRATAAGNRARVFDHSDVEVDDGTTHRLRGILPTGYIVTAFGKYEDAQQTRQDLLTGGDEELDCAVH